MRRWTASEEPDATQLAEIAAMLSGGGVALLPTDTVYGLHAVADDAAAVDRIAAMKGRPEGKPFIVIAASIEQLEGMQLVVPEVLRELWPAPLTAILRRAGGETVAVRIPLLPWLRALAARTGPLVSTSANEAGKPPITAPNELSFDLQSKLDGLLDAGPRVGEPSAIVDFTSDPPRLVREGHRSFTQKLRKTLRKTL